MGLWSDIGSIAGAFIGGPTGAAIGGAIGGAIDGATTGKKNIGSAAEGAVAGGAGGYALGEGIRGIEAAIGGSLGNSIGSVLSGVGNIVQNLASSVSGTIKTIGTDIQGIIGPVQSALHAVSGITGTIQNDIINPIVSPIQTILGQYNELVTQLHNDVHQGLQAELQIPGQISRALGSVDASLSRSFQVLTQGQADIVQRYLNPGMELAGAKPLADLNETLRAPTHYTTDQAVFERLVNLKGTTAANEATATVADLIAAIKDSSGPWSFLLKGLWDILSVADYVIASMHHALQPVYQQAEADNPYTLLGPGEVIEAWRRGILSDQDAQDELLKHGVNLSRQQVMYDLAQYLFSPAEALVLLRRSLIDQTQFGELMDQHNLDQGQRQALLDMTMWWPSLGDAITALARGYISQDEYVRITGGLAMSGEFADLVKQLPTEILRPGLDIKTWGRRMARDKGLLPGTLTSAPPDEIRTTFDRNQVDQEVADREWLEHWNIPGIEWWVEGYFRGVVTQEQVKLVMEAENYDPELFDILMANAEELPPVWLVPDIVGTGVWTAEEAIPTLRKLGFSEASAKVLYEYGYSKSAAGKAALAGSLQKLAISTAATLYEDGVIDAAKYEEILVEHGYSTEAATLQIELENIKAAATARKAAATDLVDQVKLGTMDMQTAIAALEQGGYTQDEISKYALAIQRAAKVNTKLPSEAILIKGYKAGALTTDQLTSALQQLGYSLTWAQFIVQVEG